MKPNREMETREAESRVENWKPPSLLPDPTPVPTGDSGGFANQSVVKLTPPTCPCVFVKDGLLRERRITRRSWLRSS